MWEIGCFAIPVLVLLILILEAESQRKKREKAKEAYYSSLEELKHSPSDPELRQEVLELGRDYSRLTRKGKVVLYDEVALMNDINAACAGASMPGSSSARGRLAATLTERLENLETLRKRGLVSEDEYSSQRARLLDEL